MKIHVFVFPFVSSQRLIYHIDEVLFLDPSEHCHSWDQRILALQDFADEICVLELLAVSQSVFENGVQNLVESHLALPIYESILEDPLRFVYETLNEAGGIGNVVSKQVKDDLSDVSRGE